MPPPNIVIIMTDQQRADFTKAEGWPLDTTPFIDTLGRGGVRFSRAYTPMPICGPARCSLFTGRYPTAHRVRQNSRMAENIHRPKDLVETLREHGYSINLTGKNHSYLPRDTFDFITQYSHWEVLYPDNRTSAERAFDAWMRTLDLGIYLEPTPFPLECQLAYRIVSDAINCLQRRDERPFFLWLSFPEPHNPYQVPEPYFSLFPLASIPAPLAGPDVADSKGPKWRWERRLLLSKWPGMDMHAARQRANYCGMLRLIDDQVRRFMAYMESQALLDNTIVIFTADHGDYASDYGLMRKGVGMPECLVRVPLIFTGPGVRAGLHARTDFVSLVDIMPTLCEAIGVEPEYGVQGRSLWPLLSGQNYPQEEFRSIYAELGYGGLHYGEHEHPQLHFSYDGPVFDELNSVTQSGNTKMVRMGRWKLLFDMMGEGELYDLASDPAELRNRYNDPALAAVQCELMAELLTWTIRSQDDLPDGNYTPRRVLRNWYATGAQETERPSGRS